MKLVTYTTLYPNSCQPRHGIFVENRLKNLLTLEEVESIVVAPVPWFPFKSKLFGAYSVYANIPKKEIRDGITIFHPRYLVIPKIGMIFTPFFMALSSYQCIKKLISSGYKFQVLDAHYFYPDGVAACILSKLFKKNFIVTARGTDINLIPKFNLPRKLILWAAFNAKKIITVCEALKKELINIGVEKDKIKVLRNGVDFNHFNIKISQEISRRKELKSKTILSVGHLINRKGHNYVIEALQYIEDCNLIVVGGGELEKQLKKLSYDLKLQDRVVFVGEVSHKKMPEYYNIADVLVLASDREGLANVLIESLACGTPVVAFNAWGASEVIKHEVAGRLVDRRDAISFAKEINYLLSNLPDRNAVRKYAEQFSWDVTTNGQFSILNEIVL